MMPDQTQHRSPLAALRRFVKPQPRAEHCELCSAMLPPEHEHLLEPATRQLHCCCQACAILFSGQQSVRFRRVPRRWRYVPDFRMTDAQWESLGIPINLAFFYWSTPTDQVIALYPSPGGATESLLALEAWSFLVEDNPILADMEPDVEALLVNRVGPVREYFLVPIDECFKLVGMIRRRWQGFSGGAEVWAEIERFFAVLKERAEPAGGIADA